MKRMRARTSGRTRPNDRAMLRMAVSSSGGAGGGSGRVLTSRDSSSSDDVASRRRMLSATSGLDASEEERVAPGHVKVPQTTGPVGFLNPEGIADVFGTSVTASRLPRGTRREGYLITADAGYVTESVAEYRVKIVRLPEGACLALGFALGGITIKSTVMPGWESGVFAVHSDDGKFFDLGPDGDGTPACRGFREGDVVKLEASEDEFSVAINGEVEFTTSLGSMPASVRSLVPVVGFDTEGISIGVEFGAPRRRGAARRK